MALGQNHAAPASDATNVNFTNVVRGWGRLSSRLYLWCVRQESCLPVCLCACVPLQHYNYEYTIN